MDSGVGGGGSQSILYPDGDITACSHRSSVVTTQQPIKRPHSFDLREGGRELDSSYEAERIAQDEVYRRVIKKRDCYSWIDPFRGRK